jgi:acyl-CoA hydrolase
VNHTNTICATDVCMTEIVMPQHTNPIGVVFGGVLMSWIDIASAIAASRHSRQYVSTKSIDALDFIAPIKLGWIVNIKARINRVWNSSMEVGVYISAENPVKGEEVHTATAYLTMVALDEQGRPVPIKKITPQTDDEKRRFEEAGQRRAVRLANKKAT